MPFLALSVCPPRFGDPSAHTLPGTMTVVFAVFAIVPLLLFHHLCLCCCCCFFSSCSWRRCFFLCSLVTPRFPHPCRPRRVLENHTDLLGEAVLLICTGAGVTPAIAVASRYEEGNGEDLLSMSAAFRQKQLRGPFTLVEQSQSELARPLQVGSELIKLIPPGSTRVGACASTHPCWCCTERGLFFSTRTEEHMLASRHLYRGITHRSFCARSPRDRRAYFLSLRFSVTSPLVVRSSVPTLRAARSAVPARQVFDDEEHPPPVDCERPRHSSALREAGTQ